MVLQTLDSLGLLHGYAIAARLEQVSSGALQLNMGTLYPALMRLEQRFTHNVRLVDDGGDTMQLAPGESVSFTFHGVGEHNYDCSFHPNDMTGVVIVTEPLIGTPSPTQRRPSR